MVTCTPVTQRARPRSPVGTSFLGEVFRGFSSPVRQMSGSLRPPRSPNIIWPSLSSLIIHYGREWPEMLTRPKTSYIHTNIHKLRLKLPYIGISTITTFLLHHVIYSFSCLLIVSRQLVKFMLYFPFSLLLPPFLPLISSTSFTIYLVSFSHL